MTPTRFAPPAQVGERLTQYTVLAKVHIEDLPAWLHEHGRQICPRRDGQPNLVWPSWPANQTPILLVESNPESAASA